MGLIHGSPYWTPIASGVASYSFRTDEDVFVQGWKIQHENNYGKKFRLFSELTLTVIKETKKIAMHIQKKFSKKDEGFALNPLESLEALAKDFLLNGNLIRKEVYELAQKYFCIQQGKEPSPISRGDAQTTVSNRFIFSHQSSEENLKIWIREMFFEAKHFFLLETNHSLGRFSFSKKDLTFLGKIKHKIQRQAESINCFTYALLKRQDALARDIIDGKKNELTVKDLKNCGYRIVSHPDQGDLVLYLKNEDSHGVCSHLGIYTPEGLVESKWGNLTPEIFRHTIFNVPESYGKRVAFMRKSLARLD